MDLTLASPNVPVYLQMWKNDQDVGVSGPYGSNTDQQGRWSLSGRIDPTATGSWRIKAVIADRDSTERSGTIAVNAVS